mgnify:CR=1 FL=1
MGNRQAANEGSDSRHRRCNKHSIFPAFCQGWRSNGRSASGPGWSVATQPAGIHNGQFRVDLPPVSNGQGPFFRQFPGCQVERLSEAHGVGEDRAPTVQPPESAVQALDRVGRIHDPPSGLRKLEHRADAVPVVRPAVHAAGISGLPGCPNLIQTTQSGLLVRCVVDRLQVIGEGLLVLVRHVFQRVAHHMHDAPLVLRLRIRRRYGFPDSAQAIRADHENVLYAAVFQLIEHAQPEFCALVLADRDAQNFLPAFLVDAEDHIRRRFADPIVLPHVEHHGVNVCDGIYRAQRPLLPRLDLRQQPVRNGRDHPFADLKPVDVLDLLRNLRYAHPLRTSR